MLEPHWLQRHIHTFPVHTSPGKGTLLMLLNLRVLNPCVSYLWDQQATGCCHVQGAVEEEALYGVSMELFPAHCHCSRGAVWHLGPQLFSLQSNAWAHQWWTDSFWEEFCHSGAVCSWIVIATLNPWILVVLMQPIRIEKRYVLSVLCFVLYPMLKV